MERWGRIEQQVSQARYEQRKSQVAHQTGMETPLPSTSTEHPPEERFNTLEELVSSARNESNGWLNGKLASVVRGMRRFWGKRQEAEIEAQAI